MSALRGKRNGGGVDAPIDARTTREDVVPLSILGPGDSATVGPEVGATARGRRPRLGPSAERAGPEDHRAVRLGGRGRGRAWRAPEGTADAASLSEEVLRVGHEPRRVPCHVAEG